MKDTPQNIVKYLIEKSKISLARISRDMGKSDNFLSVTLGKGSILRLDTFLSLCKETGWKVKLVGHDEEFYISLPDTISSEERQK